MITMYKNAVAGGADEDAKPWLRFVVAVRESAAETIRRHEALPHYGILAAEIARVYDLKA